jgi:hypothetical protein
MVIVTYEMIHDTRVIYTDGRPHVGTRLRQYLGDSRGRWEGESLVVETTNLTDQTSIGAGGLGLRHSAEMILTERFTRVAADILQYPSGPKIVRLRTIDGAASSDLAGGFRKPIRDNPVPVPRHRQPRQTYLPGSKRSRHSYGLTRFSGFHTKYRLRSKDFVKLTGSVVVRM